MRKVLCVARQYGSDGHHIAREFAEQKGIAYYDRKIMEDAIQVSGIDEDVLRKAEERSANPFLAPVYFEGNLIEHYGKNANDIIFEIESQLILEYAEKGDCVIVGRCADVILRKEGKYNVKNIFFCAPMAARIAMVAEHEGVSEKEAASKIRKADKARSSYYDFYTDKDWGKPSDYDFTINTASQSREYILKCMNEIYDEM